MSERGPGRPPLADAPRDVRMALRATATEAEAWRAAAAAADSSFAAWAAERLNDAASPPPFGASIVESGWSIGPCPNVTPGCVLLLAEDDGAVVFTVGRDLWGRDLWVSEMGSLEPGQRVGLHILVRLPATQL